MAQSDTSTGNIKTKNKFTWVKGIHPTKTKPKIRKIYGFDTETYEKDLKNDNQNFLFGSIVGENEGFFFKNKLEWEKLLHNQKFRNAFMCATNLAFDLQSIYTCFSKKPIEEMLKKYSMIERSGSIIFAYTYVPYDSRNQNIYSKGELRNKLAKISGEQLKIELKKYYKIYFIDSISHLRASVENLGRIIKIDKMQKPERLGMMPLNADEYLYTLKYNVNDSKITFKFMSWLQNEYNKLGCELKPTISSTSLDLFKRKFLKMVISQEDKKKVLFQYKAYYGGRCEVLKRGRFTKENFGIVKCYDVNSLYPFILKTGVFPYPKSYWIKKCDEQLIQSFEGLANLELECPKNLEMPILPVRHKGKLIFPTGLIKGLFTFIEVRYALTLGYKITKFGGALVYYNKFNPFTNFISELYNYRMKRLEKNDSSQLVPKILMNSFYGKMGFRFDNKEELILESFIKSDDELQSFTQFQMYKGNRVCRVCRGEDSVMPSYVIPILSIYVTSQARIHMHKLYKQIGYKNILYTDTDSIFTRKNLLTSKKLGSLKLEESYEDIIFIKPKIYGSSKNIKIKGMPKLEITYIQFVEMLRTGKITTNQYEELTGKKIFSFTKLRSSLIGKNKVNSVVKINKELELNDNKRLWSEDEFNLQIQDSKPLHFTRKCYIEEQ